MRGTPPSTGDMVNPMARYTHLLNPIRDLVRNWEIDVAAELEEYLSELENIKISFDGGTTTMNFAQAALLIQGTACIYSKKVEYLYALVYQTLDLIASKKRLQQAASVDDQGKDKDVSFQDKREEEFLILDDLKEAKNIDMKGDDQDFVVSESAKLIPQTPLALTPNESDGKEDNALFSSKGEVLGSKYDFKMNTCSVLPEAGAFVSDLKSFASWSTSQFMFPTPLITDTECLKTPVIEEEVESNDKDGNLNPPPGDEQLDDNFEQDDDVEPFEPLSPPAEPAEEGSGRMRLRARQPSPPPVAISLPPERDYWEMLNPHDSAGKSDDNKPLKKGCPFKIPPSLVAMKKGKKRKRKGETATEEPEKPYLQPLTEFCTKAFYSHASKLPKNPLKALAFAEFEYLYWIEHNKRLEFIKQERKELAEKLPPKEMEEVQTMMQEVNKGEEDGNLDDFGDDEVFRDDNFGGDDYGDDDDDDDDDVNEEDRVCVAPIALEEPLEDLVISSYEEMVRKYVKNFMAEAQQYAQETDLTRRVREWEEKILPTLEDEESHRPYDIHQYGSEVLESFSDNQRRPFGEVVQGKEPFEICRYFLATLQLANNRNVEISADGQGANAMDTMSLELLHKKQVNEDIAAYRAPSLDT